MYTTLQQILVVIHLENSLLSNERHNEDNTK